MLADVSRGTWGRFWGELGMFHVKHLKVFGLAIVSRETNPQPSNSRVCRQADHAGVVFRGVKTEPIEELNWPSGGVRNGGFGHD